ncbi:hypothetical protein BJV78DRAFT_1154212 [Lactifluus subvellereus]|nr:hypothetical protein BJV78DRAFT_1154212 [Lactifluus subvellereus]
MNRFWLLSASHGAAHRRPKQVVWHKNRRKLPVFGLNDVAVAVLATAAERVPIPWSLVYLYFSADHQALWLGYRKRGRSNEARCNLTTQTGASLQQRAGWESRASALEWGGPEERLEEIIIWNCRAVFDGSTESSSTTVGLGGVCAWRAQPPKDNGSEAALFKLKKGEDRICLMKCSSECATHAGHNQGRVLSEITYGGRTRSARHSGRHVARRRDRLAGEGRLRTGRQEGKDGDWVVGRRAE